MEKKYMAFEFEVKETDDSGNVGYIEGYASTFGNIDLGDDVVEKGAFRKTIKDKKGKFPILLDHMMTKQIGWNIEAEEDDIGLKVKGEIQLETEEARNRYKLAKRAKEIGTKMGLSIGYQTIKAESDKERPAVRRLKELKLFEYSFVTFPMNEMASITAAKAQQLTSLFDLLQDGSYDLNKVKAALMVLNKEPRAAKEETDPSLLKSVEQLTESIKGFSSLWRQ